MPDYTITDADLMAYIHGERDLRVEQALNQSAELRAELEAMQRTEDKFLSLIGGIDLPRPELEDVIAYALGKATANQQLIVSAYERRSAFGRAEIEEVKQIFGVSESAPVKPKILRFFARPMASLGTRGADQVEDRPLLTISRFVGLEGSFEATEVNIQVTLTIESPKKTEWNIRGRITQAGSELGNKRVTLRRPELRPKTYSSTTDDTGAFGFSSIPSANYRLRVYLDDAIIQFPELELTDG